MFRSFGGGIRFDMSDNEAAKTDIRRFDECSVFCISMRQIDAECEPTVSVGARVLKNERVGRAVNENGVDVYSPVSGSVVSVEERPHPVYKSSLCVIIESDGRDEIYPPFEQTDAEKFTAESLFDIARRAAIPGPDMFSPPEYQRMRKMVRDGVKTLVCPCLDCEPYIGVNTRVCVEYALEVISGFKLMMRAIGAQNGIMVYTGGSPAEAELRRALKNGNGVSGETKIRLSRVVNKYPVLQKLSDMFETAPLEISASPAKAGVTSPFACLALSRAVCKSQPVTSVFISVAGTAIGKSGVYEVPIGASVKDLLHRALVSDDVRAVISNGVMRGVALESDEYPVLLSMSALTAVKETATFLRNDECIHCNECGKVCPKGLSPSQICEYILHNDVKEASRLGLNECILCGCCTYICPGRMELNEILRKGKEAMRK